MKNKNNFLTVAAVSLFGVFFILYFIVGREAALFIRYGLISMLGLLFLFIVILSFRQKKIMERELSILSGKLRDLSVSSGELFTSYSDFYNQFISCIRRFINEKENIGEFQADGIKKNEKEFEKQQNLRNLTELADSIIDKSKQIIDSAGGSMIKLRNEIGEMDEQMKNTSDIKGILLEIQYFSDIIYEFMASIIKDFSASTEPLSKGIYNIKLRTRDFLDNVTKWNNDLTNEKSERNFNKIILTYNRQNEEFKHIFQHLDENYNYLEDNLDSIMSKFKVLLENTDAINEISENIRLLSINASLESVRAGNFGKGFKIVADEVKKLSGMTQSYVKNIIPLIKETNNMVAKTLENFESGRKKIIEKINNQKSEFDTFYDILKNYYQDFNKIFSFISNVITDVNVNIDNLVPIFNLSNLSQQEMENLNRMIQMFLKKHDTDISQNIGGISKDEKKLVLENLISIFDKAITTGKELDVINSIYEKLGFEKMDLKKTDKEVELF